MDINMEYALGLSNGGKIFNPYKTNNYPGRYANDCNNISKIKKGKATYTSSCANAKLTTSPKQRMAEVYALKTIKEGEEIFVRYGHGYWGLGVHGQKKQVSGVNTTVTRQRKRVQRYGQ